uniref:Uncharacterized protein n=1 Tax=Anguilla anguilla TaxID=7936 RepID=A0A0E9U263_ANGAN
MFTDSYLFYCSKLALIWFPLMPQVTDS